MPWPSFTVYLVHRLGILSSAGQVGKTGLALRVPAGSQVGGLVSLPWLSSVSPSLLE